MVRIAIEQFQQNPLDAIRRVEAGETILIVRNDAPVVEMKPACRKRPIGLAAGEFTVPTDIAEPLPPDAIRDLEGT